jgi:hypothetical protein
MLEETYFLLMELNAFQAIRSPRLRIQQGEVPVRSGCFQRLRPVLHPSIYWVTKVSKKY